MTRTRLRIAVLLGAVAAAATATGIGIWLATPAGVPLAGNPAPASPAPAGFNFTRLDAPRPVAAFAFTDGDGRKLSLADFRGRVVLLNLWATWCVPCRKEMPSLDRLEARLGGPEFEVVALSIDRQGLGAVRPFFADLKLKALRIYLDRSGKAAGELGAPGVPTSLLIDRRGRELGRVVGRAEWDGPEVEAVIRGYLAENAAAIPSANPVRKEVSR